MSGKQPEESFLNGRTNEILLGFLTVVTVGIGIRSFLRLNQWEKKYRKRAKWLTWFRILLSLIPLVLFVSLPKVVPFIARGRVLSWERIFLMMPSVFIWLMLAAVFSVVII